LFGEGKTKENTTHKSPCILGSELEKLCTVGACVSN